MTSTYTQEIQKGGTTYRVTISTDASGDMVVDLLGATCDGTVVADGRLRLPSSDGVDIGKTTAKALVAQSRLAGRRPKALNAGAPWSKELDEHLKAQWLKLNPTGDAARCLHGLADAMQRPPRRFGLGCRAWAATPMSPAVSCRLPQRAYSGHNRTQSGRRSSADAMSKSWSDRRRTGREDKGSSAVNTSPRDAHELSIGHRLST